MVVVEPFGDHEKRRRKAIKELKKRGKLIEC